MVTADICLYREGLTRLLDASDDLEVVATAATSEQALEHLAEYSPDSLLVDLAMADGLSLVSRVRQVDPKVRIIALTVEELERSIISCAEAGVDGFVTREASVKELMETIRAADAGELRCSPRVAASLLRRVSHLAARRDPLEALTNREVEVLSLIERGQANQTIARSLGIELATVKNHVHNILDKLQVRSRGEAAAAFRRSGPLQSRVS